MGLAYLLFRVADTFEDAFVWPASRRVAALETLVTLLERRDLEAARRASRAWLEGPDGPPTDHEGYRDLLRALPEVLEALNALPAGAASIVVSHVVRTSEGMASIVAAQDGRAEGRIALASLEELREYCYVVAGIVGELLTALFLHDAPALAEPSVARELTSRQRAFGEALQLVNILKDQNVDAGEGRSFLPKSVRRADVLALARRDVEDAAVYVATLERAGAPSGFIAFTGLPLELAKANLDLLERDGPGAKLPRSLVAEAFTRFFALARGSAVTP